MSSHWKNGAGLALLIGGLLLFDGWRDRKVLALGTPQPARVPLSELAAGRVANVHVTVTDFTFGSGRVIEEQDGKWNRVWIPMLVPGAQDAAAVAAVVRSFQIADEAQLRAFLAKTEVTGIITNEVDGRMGGDEADLLRERHPGLDPARLPLIAEGRAFPGEEAMRYKLLGSGAMAMVAAFCAWRWLATR